MAGKTYGGLGGPTRLDQPPDERGERVQIRPGAGMVYAALGGPGKRRRLGSL